MGRRAGASPLTGRGRLSPACAANLKFQSQRFNLMRGAPRRCCCVLIWKSIISGEMVSDGDGMGDWSLLALSQQFSMRKGSFTTAVAFTPNNVHTSRGVHTRTVQRSGVHTGHVHIEEVFTQEELMNTRRAVHTRFTHWVCSKCTRKFPGPTFKRCNNAEKPQQHQRALTAHPTFGPTANAFVT